MKIAAVGDNCIDLYFETGKAYPGGNPVNVSVYAARLGQQASYTGAVGNDAYGALLRTALERKGVDVSHLHILPGRTAVTQVRIQNGERVFCGYDEGVLADFKLTPADLDFLCGQDLVVTGLWGKVENQLHLIRARGVPVAFDFANKQTGPVLETALPQVDYAFFSHEGEPDAALEAFMQAAKAKGPQVVTVTLGERGSLAYDGREFVRCGIVPCPVKDTMGAGDSFIAGFLVGILQGRPLAECMGLGAESSSVTLQYFGAWE